MVQSERECRMCGGPIPSERLERWPWAVTCSPPCADANFAESGRQARRRYRRRRRRASAELKERAAGGRQQQKEDGGHVARGEARAGGQ